ncbi:hypothetical protein [Streptomyces pratensis]|uniref:hypothetical protein n=1 Tax=Streptomyces pratensis TaxID=1169025 RepID=UPI001EE3F630|nr:hypothetical protein [Streptomyces pratensis]
MSDAPFIERFHGGSPAAVAGRMLLIAVPLTTGTISVARDRSLAADARPAAERWAATGKWQIASVEGRRGVVVIGVLGLPPQPAPTVLRAALARNGMRTSNFIWWAAAPTGARRTPTPAPCGTRPSADLGSRSSRGLRKCCPAPAPGPAGSGCSATVAPP